jgi:hypothetical protein
MLLHNSYYTLDLMDVTGQEAVVEGKQSVESAYTNLGAVYPQDINDEQTFPINPEAQQLIQLKLTFTRSTDFFGRITIYTFKID